MSYFRIKRFLDLLFSFLGIVILSPLALVIVLAIKIDSKGPVLFKQKRVGKGKKHFYINKFRTMKLDAPKDVPTHLFVDSKHITKVGVFLRKASLDELPQLWNIFIGQMSVVGPRPALWNQYDLITERDKYGVNTLTPGLTGWAQINGRDELPIAIKARLDGEYAQKVSFWLDVRCVCKTIMSVIKSDGVVEGGTESIRENLTRLPFNEEKEYR